MTVPARPELLIGADRIQQRVSELGAAITRDYVGCEPVLIVVLKGSFIFAADLSRAIDLATRIEFLGVQSYGASTRSSGVVQIMQDLTHPIQGREVLIVEDIVDTGLTSHYLLEQLSTRRPNSVKLCALLHKPARCEIDVPIEYLGFTIDDKFVVGYGLDHDQRYRNLPDICVIPA